MELTKRDSYDITDATGNKLISAYRAYSDPGKPWCVIAWPLESMSFTLMPSDTEDFDDGVSAHEYDAINARRWADALAELIVKSRLYDQSMETVKEVA